MKDTQVKRGRISDDLLRSILDQNKRSYEAGNLEFTQQMLDKIKEREPLLKDMIAGIATGAANEMTEKYGLDCEERGVLIIQFCHAMAMVANAYETQRDAEEMENMFG